MFFDVPHFCLVPNYCEAALHSLFFLIVSKVVSACIMYVCEEVQDDIQ